MSIKDEFEKLREEILTKMDLFEEKIEVEPPKDWTPRIGEIVEMSDNGNDWILRRYYCETDFGFADKSGESWERCRPLNDPLVIQLIPHKPGNPRPTEKPLIIMYEDGAYDTASASGVDWGDDNDEGFNVAAWFPIG